MKRDIIAGVLLLCVLLGAGTAAARPDISDTTGKKAATAEPDVSDTVGGRAAAYLEEKKIPPEAIVVLIAALPIVELRGAIPVAHHMFSMNPVLAYVLAVAGNMIPVIPLLLFLGPASAFCMRVKPGKVFFEWFFKRARGKSAQVQKYETLGLSLFVAIPLPVTGAWTGSAVAFLTDIKFSHAFWSIFLGVSVSGIIVTGISQLGWIGAVVAGTVLLILAVSGMVKMFSH